MANVFYRALRVARRSSYVLGAIVAVLSAPAMVLSIVTDGLSAASATAATAPRDVVARQATVRLDAVARPGAAGLGASLPAARQTPQTGGACSVPGIGDIGGLLGFCANGSSGLIGDLNNICQPSVPTPEPATSGIDSLVKPAAATTGTSGPPTLYARYGVAGQSWAAYDLQCSDMTSLIGNNVAGVVFDAAKALDRVTITVYQSAAGEGILSWLTGAVDRLITSLGNAIYFPYLAPVVIIGAIWLAWQGLIRKRATRTIEGTLWMVVAAAAAIWLIGRPADFTGLGRTVSDGMTQTLNVAFAKLPAPQQSSCVPVGRNDPQVPATATFSYTSGNSIVDQNANELWTVLVCKPWLDGEFGITSYAAGRGGHPTPVNAYGRALLWSQAIAANEKATPDLIQAKEDAYAGIAASLKQQDPAVYPLFQGKEWTTRLEIAFAAMFAALVAGLLVLLIAITLIILKLGFLLLLVVGPFFLIVGTHPGFGRVIALRWGEMLIGVLLKQAAIALVLSVLLYAYSLIMGTSDAALPWALKILMISLVTVAVFIYRKPFAHLFSAVGYGMIGSRDRAETQLSRAGQSASRNTLDAATVGVPGFAAYRVARWARRNPAQAAGVATAAATGSAAGAAIAAAGAAGDGAGPSAGGSAEGGGPGGDSPGPNGRPGLPGRARNRADVGVDSVAGRTPPPLNLPPRGPAGAPPSGSGWSRGAPGAAGRPPASRPPGRGAPPPAAPAARQPAPGPSVPAPRPGEPGAAVGSRQNRPFWLRPLRRRDERPR